MSWKVLGGSVVGSSHLRRGLGCDDAHGWIVEEGLAVIAIADGAGSRAEAALGAHVAVGAILDRARGADIADRNEAMPEDLMAELFHAARDAVDREAVARGSTIGMQASTLSVCVVSSSTLSIGQIGDGIAVVGSEESVDAVAVGESFEYAGETVFLTSERAIEDHLKLHTRPSASLRGLGLSTDGLKYKMLDDVRETTPFVPFFETSWDYARRDDASSEAIRSFLEQVDDQTGDDKTLVIAVPWKEAGPDEQRSAHPGHMVIGPPC